ncbi:hypothetical protein QJS10_CPA03g02155 [Acorus calamus]|uniref:S-adenosyl-L-methionine-dependent methyltransferase n=1 Tax=Acorus calamus TaxID=4465 RepID=A0AAV9FCM5_ACOCL|nr:hypothetical protein QJS10_CPA03g02155 [Acorus calamus]
MGSVSLKIGDGTARFRRATLCSSALHLLMLLSVVTTNLFALYAFTRHPNNGGDGRGGHQKNLSLISERVSQILREIESSQKRLASIEREILGYDTLDPNQPSVPPELRLFLRRHPLPLGRDSRSGITDMASSVSHLCSSPSSLPLLSHFSSYEPYSPCPANADLSLAVKLVTRGCEPLPRRRCASKSPSRAITGDSLWGLVPDKAIDWSGFGCKSFDCLYKKPIGREFDLINGSERFRWVRSRGKNDFLVDEVLGLGRGNVRIGFDIGGGTAGFAARMAERNVTVVTSTLDIDAPFSQFVAARGLFPLFLTAGQRFPFHDGVFDLVHVWNGFGEGNKRKEWLEFLMFDVDRVLRVGGLLWLDNYQCLDDERKRELTMLIERFGYKKLKWVVGEKADTGNAGGKPKVYLSAVLQKPPRG